MDKKAFQNDKELEPQELQKHLLDELKKEMWIQQIVTEIVNQETLERMNYFNSYTFQRMFSVVNKLRLAVQYLYFDLARLRSLLNGKDIPHWDEILPSSRKDLIIKEGLRNGVPQKLLMALRLKEIPIPEDEGNPGCEERLPVCKSVCCIFRFPLSPKEVLKRKIEWDLDDPFVAKKDKNGICVHHDLITSRCRVYEDRPEICSRYSCREDPRIWENYAEMKLSPRAQYMIRKLEGIPEEQLKETPGSQMEVDLDMAPSNLDREIEEQSGGENNE